MKIIKTAIKKIPPKPTNEIHAWALAGAATAAALPAGADSVALSAEEVAMVIRIGSLFGASLDKSTALGVVSAIVAASAGSVIAGIATFEAANAGYPLTIPIKVGIAAGIIEGIGHGAFEYFKDEFNLE